MSAKYGEGDTTFQAAGGESGIRQLVEDFYDVMSNRDYAQTIRQMHPTDLEISIDKLARFLCGWTGGPKLYSEKYGGIAIPPAHSHLKVGELEKNAWLDCMKEALEQQEYPIEFRQYMLEQLAVPAGRIVLVRQKIEQSQQQQSQQQQSQQQ
jgi:hemoglobin